MGLPASVRPPSQLGLPCPGLPSSAAACCARAGKAGLSAPSGGEDAATRDPEAAPDDSAGRRQPEGTLLPGSPPPCWGLRKVSGRFDLHGYAFPLLTNGSRSGNGYIRNAHIRAVYITCEYVLAWQAKRSPRSRAEQLLIVAMYSDADKARQVFNHGCSDV